MTSQANCYFALSSLSASAYGSASSELFFNMAPCAKDYALFAKVNDLSGTGNLKIRVDHAADSFVAGCWVPLMSCAALTAASAVSTVWESQSNQKRMLFPYGRITATVESTNAGATTFTSIVAKFLSDK